MTSTIHQHRDRHGTRLYATTDDNRVVLTLTSRANPGVSRVEFTPAEWQALVNAVATRASVHALTGKGGVQR